MTAKIILYLLLITDGTSPYWIPTVSITPIAQYENLEDCQAERELKTSGENEHWICGASVAGG